MATARYWRIVGLSTVGGGDLELSALHLYDGATRVGAAITPTCSHAPAAGALADLSDTDLGSVCRFAAAAVRSGGFWLAWDLGTPAQVTTLLPGSGAQRASFLAGVMLQSRAASTDPWGDPAPLGRYPWPGASTMVAMVAGVDDAVLRLHGDGTNGSTTIVDSSPVARLPAALGAATISTDQASAYGGASIKFNGTAPLTYAHTADLVPATNFAVRLRLWAPTQSGAIRIVLLKASTTGHRPYGIQIDAAGYLQCHCSNTAPSIVNILSSRKVTAAGWTYIEYNRTGNTLRLFMDGDLVASGAVSGNNYVNASDKLCIGATSDSNYPLSSGGAAYIEELSIAAGGGSTANYTPPTGPEDGAGDAIAFTPFDRVTPATRRHLAYSSAIAPGATVRGDRENLLARDMEFGGAGTIAGQTLVKDAGPEVPTRARVRLLRARDGVLARETWSDPTTGAYSFTGLDTTQQFVALAQKPDGTYEPVAGGPLTPQVP